MADPRPMFGNPGGLRGVLKKLVAGNAQYRLSDVDAARLRDEVRSADAAGGAGAGHGRQDG